VDLGRGDGLGLKDQVPGGAGVVDEGAGEAVVEGGPGGGVDAHVAHGPGDDYCIHPGALQHLQQAGVPEGVGIMFPDQGLAGERPDAVVDFHPGGTGAEEGGPRPQGQVLHGENGPPYPPAAGQQFPGLSRGLAHARQLHGAAGKIIILDIDEDESGFQGAAPYNNSMSIAAYSIEKTAAAAFSWWHRRLACAGAG